MHYSVSANNFDLIRLLLAATVVLSHMVAILPADYGTLKICVEVFSGANAVDCFFVISGFLIFQSYRRSSGPWSYAAKRLRRIYPALVVVVLVCAIGGAALTTLPLARYVSDGALRYVFFNLLFTTFKQQTLPGVFETSVYAYVNGPLWTLKVEVMFYIAVPLIVLLSRRFLRFPVLAATIYVASVAFRMTMMRLAVTHHNSLFDELGRQLPGQMSFFMAGGLIEYAFSTYRRYCRALVPLAAVALGFCGILGNTSLIAYPFYPAGLAIIVIFLCTVIPRLVPAAKYGDLSYGLYIVHYPIIQTFATLGVLSAYPFPRSCAVLICCVGAALLSWHLVEKPWLHQAGRATPRFAAAAG